MWNKIWKRLNLLWKIVIPVAIIRISINSSPINIDEATIIWVSQLPLLSHKIELECYINIKNNYRITLEIKADTENIVCIISETNLRGIR